MPADGFVRADQHTRFPVWHPSDAHRANFRVRDREERERLFQLEFPEMRLAIAEKGKAQAEAERDCLLQMLNDPGVTISPDARERFRAEWERVRYQGGSDAR